jgi:hypothetical protein
MKSSTWAAAVAAATLIAGTIANPTSSHAAPPGTVYAFHSNANGTCPVLDWHIVSGENGMLNGMVSWDGMKSMAHVSGTVGPDGMIKMTATEVGGSNRTADVTGDAKNDGWLLLSLKGPQVDCPNIKVPIWRTSGATQSGGGG